MTPEQQQQQIKLFLNLQRQQQLQAQVQAQKAHQAKLQQGKIPTPVQVGCLVKYHIDVHVLPSYIVIGLYIHKVFLNFADAVLSYGEYIDMVAWKHNWTKMYCLKFKISLKQRI